ncbi:MAG: hypothetical protein ICV54_17710 [Nostoc sp. C3-bin3]|nr:hypothetical protein [Nostoc sp. C3-bin3]
MGHIHKVIPNIGNDVFDDFEQEGVYYRTASRRYRPSVMGEAEAIAASTTLHQKCQITNVSPCLQIQIFIFLIIIHNKLKPKYLTNRLSYHNRLEFL